MRSSKRCLLCAAMTVVVCFCTGMLWAQEAPLGGRAAPDAAAAARGEVVMGAGDTLCAFQLLGEGR